MKFNIVKEAGIFEIRYREESHHLPYSKNSDAYSIIDINNSYISGCEYNSLFCELESEMSFSAYRLNSNIRGSWSESLFNSSDWELTLRITSLSSYSYTNFVVHGNMGRYHDIHYLYYNIGKSICEFLNKLSMFKSLEDFKEYELIEKESYNLDLEQRILDLSKIITLCKKYTEINPSLAITKQMRTWIECNLKELFNTYRVKE